MAYIKNADIQGNAWVAEGAVVVGNVIIGDESSVWYNAVIRGDMAPIVIGCGCQCAGRSGDACGCGIALYRWQQCDHRT